jgi:transposase-like protein
MNEVSSEAKETILKRYAAGEKVVDLAREFNVSRSTIYLWLKKSQDNILKDH